MGTFQNVTVSVPKSCWNLYHKERREVISHEGCALVTGFNFLIKVASELPGSFISSVTRSICVSLPFDLTPCEDETKRHRRLRGMSLHQTPVWCWLDDGLLSHRTMRYKCLPFLKTYGDLGSPSKITTNQYRRVKRKTEIVCWTKAWRGQKTEGHRVDREPRWRNREWIDLNPDSMEKTERVHELGQKTCFAFYWTLNGACMNCDTSSKAHQHERWTRPA